MGITKKFKALVTFWLTCLPIGILAYFIVDGFADPTFVGWIRSSLGSNQSTPIHVPTLAAAGFLVLMAFMSTILLLLSRFNMAISKATGTAAQFGDSKKARSSLVYLAAMHGANGVFIAILTYVELLRPSGAQATVAICLSLVSAVLAIFTTIRVWPILDEMVRRIWVESLALAAGICLLLGMFWSLATSLGFVETVSLFQCLIIYNSIYFAVYMFVTAIRAPTTFTNPTLEDA
jgi:hypothetical protein